jgi:hypothetical protein
MKELRPISGVWALDEMLEKIAKQVQLMEEQRGTFANVFKTSRYQLDLCESLPLGQKYLVEGSLAKRVIATELKGLRVCGIDGGLLKKPLRGVDLVITRACATIFDYNTSGAVSAEYFPSRTTSPIIKAEMRPISWREVEVNASLERTKAELQLALKVLDQHPLDLLLVDGSLLPSIGDRLALNSNISTKYDEVNVLYKELYQKAEKTGTLLAGVVKDSRSVRFMKILSELLPHLIRREKALSSLLKINYREIVKASYDTDFFYRVLEVGERSCIFRLTSDNSNQTNNSVQTKPNSIIGFYLRPVKFDYPLRVEVHVGKYDPVRITERVCAMLLPMSSNNEELALPAVLIETDSRARFLERDLDFLFNQFAQRLGLPRGLLKLRRERMPFH